MSKTTTTRFSTTLAAAFLAAISLASGAAQARQGEDPQAIWEAASKAHVDKDYATSTASFEKLYNLLPSGNPTRGACAYNVACGLALMGERADDAFHWLDRAALAGFGRQAGGDPTERELVKIDTDLDSLRKDPRFAKFLESVASNWRKASGASDAASDDTKEALLYAPESLDAKTPAPLLVLCHGAGGNKKQFLEQSWKDVADAAGIRLASVSGSVERSPGRMAWFAGTAAAGAAGREAYEPRIVAAVEQAKKSFAVDAERVWISGFSQGGLVALLTAARRPDVFRGSIVVAGTSDPEALGEALAKPAVKGVRFVHLVGTQDSYALKSLTEAHEALRKAGVTSDLRTFEMRHEFPKERLVELRSALEFLGGDAAKAASAPADAGGRK